MASSTHTRPCSSVSALHIDTNIASQERSSMSTPLTHHLACSSGGPLSSTRSDSLVDAGWVLSVGKSTANHVRIPGRVSSVLDHVCVRPTPLVLDTPNITSWERSASWRRFRSTPTTSQIGQLTTELGKYYTFPEHMHPATPARDHWPATVTTNSA